MVLRALDAVTRFGANIVRTTNEVNTTRLARPYAPATVWYDFLESYADNRPYDAANTLYRAKFGLSKGQRAIYNPAHRVIGWYAGHCYPPGYGDIPFDPGTPAELIDAVTTAFTWGNMQQQTSHYVKTGAKLGNVLLQAESDAESGRVYPMVIHPRYVKAMDIDHRMNITMYQTEYPMYDAVAKTSYRYGLKVTRESFTTLYNDEPHGYSGNEAETPNPFGFVPAVWVPHEVTGDTLGAPAIEAVIGKIDELNLIATAAHDFITKLVKQGVVFATKKGGAGLETVNLGGGSEQDSLRYIVGPEDLRVMKMLDDIGLAPSLEWARAMIEEIENDIPEIALEKRMQGIGNLSGIAALRLISVGNVVSRLSDAQKNYDWGLIRIGQMCVTMGAMLSASRVGGWAQQSDQQQTFNAFTAQSFDRGDLAFTFVDRPLLNETPMEKAQSAAAREALQTPQALKEVNYSDDEIYGTDEQGNSRAPQDDKNRDGLLAERQAVALQQQTRSVLSFNSGI